jgi:MoaA/NifB/PqqE/SkfB family radical SAM enzyme
MSLNHQATQFSCSWPWSTLVLTCDGRVVCGCADPYVQRVLGDVRTHTVGDVWTGDTVRALRADLNEGGSTFCGDCPLKLPLDANAVSVPRAIDAGALPSRLYIECTAACNISCLDACCAPETGITRTREAGMLDFDLFTKVVDEAGPALARIDFFNYGEAFLHKRAVEMCRYIKERFPQIYLYTSTNGLALTEARARALVHSGIDEVTFSVDGAFPESYARYRQRGDFDVALRNLRAMADEKRRADRDVPFLNWRYILFRWNDSTEEMDQARALAEEIGVDRLTWEITDHPESAYSRRFAPGTPEHTAIRREIWDDNNLGNAIPGATPRARIDLHRLVPGLPLLGRRGSRMQLRPRVQNLSTRPFPAQASYGRRLVRLGAQLRGPDGSMTDIPIEIPMPDTPGRYQLTLDLVSEGIDWFEACGSPTTTATLVVW